MMSRHDVDGSGSGSTVPVRDRRRAPERHTASLARPAWSGPAVALVPAAALAALAALAACGGCDLFRTGGNSDRGYFQIEPAADVARGGQLTYAVTDFEILPPAGRRDIGFELLSVSDPSVAEVRDSFSDGTVVIAGVAAGPAHVDFRARADGDLIEDGFALAVREVTRLQLSSCDAGGVYLRGAPAPVSYRFNPAESPALKGRGLYPVEALPPDAAVLQPDASDTETWVFDVGPASPGEVVLRSTLPGDDAHLVMTIVDPSAIDGVAPLSGPVSAGETRTIDVRPRAGGHPVCNRLSATVRSLTPSICGFDHGQADSLEVSEPTAALTFLASGTCQITLVVGDLGLALAWQSVTVSPAPIGDGGGGHHHHDDD